MTYSFANKVVIVTGASSGIGEACAKAFSNVGAHVVLAARNSLELERVAQTLQGQYLIVPCDVSIEASCQNLVEATLSHFGRLDILVNNAGISMRARFIDCDLEVIERLMKVNFWGAVYCTKYALPHLLQLKGNIVVISTTAGFVGLPARTAYSASKFALHGFFDTLRSEHSEDGLGISMIFPGFIASNIRKNALTQDGSLQGETPQEESKMIQPEFVAKQVLRAVRLRKRRIIIGIQTRAMWWVRMFFPAWLDRTVYRLLKKEKDSPLNKTGF